LLSGIENWKSYKLIPIWRCSPIPGYNPGTTQRITEM
jgi:hypothetical protein